MKKSYAAFISYSRGTEPEFAVSFPRDVRRVGHPWQPWRWLALFQDTTNLAAGDLWSELGLAIQSSNHFVLLASPAAARSLSVNWEVNEWLKAKKPGGQILLVLLDGAIQWNAADNDFDWSSSDAIPESLRGVFKSEPMYIDCREELRKDITVQAARVAARLRGVELGDLVGDERRQRRLMTTGLAATALALGLAAATATRQWLRAREQAAIATQRLAKSYSSSAQSASLERQWLEGAHYLAKLASLGGEDAERALLPLSFDDYLGPLQLKSQIDEPHCVAFAGDTTNVVQHCTDGLSFWGLEPTPHRRLHVGNAPAWTFMAAAGDAVLYAGDNIVGLWSFAGERLGPDLKHQAHVRGAATNLDGSRILTWDETDALRVWDKEGGVPLWTQSVPDISAARFDGPANNWVVAMTPSGVRLWKDLKRDSSIFEQSGDPVEGASFFDRFTKLMSWNDNDLSQYDVATQRLITADIGQQGSSGPAILSDGKLVVAYASGRGASAWNLLERKSLGTYANLEWPMGVTITPNGKTLVTWSRERARIFDLASGEEYHAAEHAGSILGATLNRDGDLLLTWSEDQTARLWTIPAGTPVGLPMRHDGRVTKAFFGDKDLIVTTSLGTTRFWRLAPERAEPRLLGSPGWNEGPVLVAGGDVAITWNTNSVYGWRTRDGGPAFPPLDLHGRIWSASVSADRMRLALRVTPSSSSPPDEDADEVVVLEVSASQVARITAIPAKAARFSPSGRFLITLNGNGELTKYEASGRDPKQLGRFEHATLNAMSCDNDCSALVIGTEGGASHVLRGSRQTVLPGQLEASAIDPTGAILAWANTDHEVRTIALDSGAESPVRVKHDTKVNGLAFVHGTARLVTWSSDGTARLVDLTHDNSIITIRQADITQLLELPSDRLLLNGSGAAQMYAADGSAVGYAMTGEGFVGVTTEESGGLVIGWAGSGNWGAIYRWNPATGAVIGLPKFTVQPVDGVAVAPNGVLVATTTADDGAVVSARVRADMDFPLSKLELELEALTGTSMNDQGQISLLNSASIAARQLEYAGVRKQHATTCVSK